MIEVEEVVIYALIGFQSIAFSMFTYLMIILPIYLDLNQLVDELATDIKMPRNSGHLF